MIAYNFLKINTYKKVWKSSRAVPEPIFSAPAVPEPEVKPELS